MMNTFLTGFIPVSLFLLGAVFYTSITVILIVVAGILFVSYLIGDVIKTEWGQND